MARTRILSYDLANSLRPSLLNRVAEVEKEFSTPESRLQLVGFRHLLTEYGMPAINMSLSTCAEFLESGEYLNFYELKAREIAGTGLDLETEVQKARPKWYKQQKRVASVLQFSYDTHFAFLNLGGSGATRYGPCCVVLDFAPWVGCSTSFAGDTVRAIFDTDGTQIIDDEHCLELFAIGEDYHHLCVLKHQSFLMSGNGMVRPVDPREVRATVEHSDSIVEIHLHGPVRSAQIKKVIIDYKEYMHLCQLSVEAERMPPHKPQEYDPVRHFKRLLKVLGEKGTPFTLAEAS